MKQKTELRFQTQSVPALVVSMSAPIMFSLLVQALYNIVDSICISSYNGHGLTAISLAFPIQLVLTALGNGAGLGSGVLISHALGVGDTGRARRLAVNGLTAAWLNWMFALLVLLPFLSAYYRYFSNTPQVVHMGVEYGWIVVSASIFLFGEIVCTRMIQARGNTVLPMLYQALGAALNIALDPILVFGLGSVPSMGIRGAAIATVSGQAVALLCALITVWHRVDFGPPKPEWRLLISIYRTGLPAILTGSLISVYIAGLNAVLAVFSEDAVSALGIYYKIQTFLLMPTYGLEQGTLPILGFNLGANNYPRVWHTVQFSLLLSTVTMLAGTAVVNLFLPQILWLFSASPDLTAIATPALHIISLAFPLFGVTILIPTLLQAAGHLKQCLSVVLLRQVILLVPLAKLLSHWGLIFTWFTFPISELVAAILCVYFLMRLKRSSQCISLSQTIEKTGVRA